MTPLERIGSTRLDLSEASGLAWDPRRRVLLVVGDDSGCAFEITLSSPPAVTRTIPLEDGDRHDLEGIALAADGSMLVTSEKKRAILVYDRDGRLLRKVKVAVDWEEK